MHLWQTYKIILTFYHRLRPLAYRWITQPRLFGHVTVIYSFSICRVTQFTGRLIALAYCGSQCVSVSKLSLTLPASVAQLAETQCAPTGGSVGGAGVQFPGSAGRFRVRVSGAHALRLISRAGKEGSTVSSIICDRWLILSLETLSN